MNGANDSVRFDPERLAKEAASASADPGERLAELEARLVRLGQKIEASRIAEYVELLQHPRALILKSLYTGIARGIGIAIGVTIFTGVILQVLHWLGALNLPIIGDWIADLIRIVEQELDTDSRAYRGWEAD